MKTISEKFGVRVGYSDHTQGWEVAVAAVSLGASVLEKHFTSDRTLEGPDHQASLEPYELKAMISAIRNVERALGDGSKVPSLIELSNRNVARKSLVARVAISQGDQFTQDNVTAKRPGTGISPMKWDEVLGRRAPRDFAIDEPIET
jgi:sialic acid synthase SpsE